MNEVNLIAMGLMVSGAVIIGILIAIDRNK